MSHAKFVIALCDDLYHQYLAAPEGHTAAGDAILATANALARAAAKVGIDVVLRDFRPFSRPNTATPVLSDEQVTTLMQTTVWPPEGWLALPNVDGWYYKDAEMLNEADLRARVGT